MELVRGVRLAAAACVSQAGAHVLRPAQVDPHHLKHAQCACQLLRLPTSCDQGRICHNLKSFVYCLREAPQCSHAPRNRHGLSTTLSRTCLLLIGILSESARGLEMFHHELSAFLFPVTRREIQAAKDKNQMGRLVGPSDCLLRSLAINLDYTHDDNIRMLFSHWIAQGGPDADPFPAMWAAFAQGRFTCASR